MVLRNKFVVPGEKGSRRLVVLIHGWWNSLPAFSIDDVESTIRDELPDADILRPVYRSHIAANTNPVDVAEALAEAIEDACKEHARRNNIPYDEIVLVGYSLGSLIVRKAFILGRLGRVAEDSGRGVSRRYSWPDKVSRIILLAGVNNGWSLRPKPKRFSWLLYVMYRLLYPWAYVLPGGDLIRSFHKGSRFVEDLRIQWHFLNRDGQIPPVIQLTGTKEDVVTFDDMVDIKFCHNFVFLHVPETGHMNAAQFGEPGVGPVRQQSFVDALTSDISDLQSRADFDTEEQLQRIQEPSVTDVVFVMHGIRDFGHWTRGVRKAIDRIAEDSGQRVVAITPAYERFPLLGLLFTFTRMKNVKWFIDIYVQTIARYPNARIHFIGHSNGTYLLAKSLELYSACRFNNVAFAGSVVRRDFPWNTFIEDARLARLRNDMAANDYIVAIFPRFFEQIKEALRLPVSDIGSAGVYGFAHDDAKRFEVLVRGGHAAAIVDGNHESLARFVLGIDQTPQVGPGLTIVELVPLSTRLLSSFCWLIWLLLFSVPPLAALASSAVWFCRDQKSPFELQPFVGWLASQPFPCLPLLVPALIVASLTWWLLKTF